MDDDFASQEEKWTRKPADKSCLWPELGWKKNLLFSSFLFCQAALGISFLLCLTALKQFWRINSTCISDLCHFQLFIPSWREEILLFLLFVPRLYYQDRAYQKQVWGSRRWKGQVSISSCLMSSLFRMASHLFVSPRREKQSLSK